MVYSNPTTKKGIVEDCDWWAGTNATTYPIADKTRNANVAVDQISARILRNTYGSSFIDDNSDDFYIVYTDLVATQDNIRLEVSHLTVERLRVKNRNGKWKTLDFVARRELSDAELEAIGVPEKFYRAGQSVLFSPIPDYSASGGVELEFQKGMDYFADVDTIKSPGFNPQFHRLISLYMARDYTAIKDQKRYGVILKEIERMEEALDNHYQHRDRAKPKSLTFKRHFSHIIL